MTDPMPAIFVGHGNPMNAYTAGWRAIGQSVPRPKAVLGISAHWYIPGCGVTANAAPIMVPNVKAIPVNLRGSPLAITFNILGLAS